MSCLVMSCLQPFALVPQLPHGKTDLDRGPSLVQDLVLTGLCRLACVRSHAMIIITRAITALYSFSGSCTLHQLSDPGERLPAAFGP